MKKKLLVTIPAVILLIAVYCMIFGFSAENGEESGTRSEVLCRFVVTGVNKIFHREWSESRVEELTEQLQLPVRKLAHFTEYGMTAILLYVIACQWVEIRFRTYLALLIWVFLTASLDELHQLQVEGRDGNIRDVLIDTAGGAFWLFLSARIGRRRYTGETKDEV